MSSRKIKILLILLALVLGCSASFFVFKKNDSMMKSNEEYDYTSQAKNNVIVFDGNEYEYNYNLTNILFLGIDKEEEVVINDSPGLGGQADCIILLSLNHELKTVELLQINRDTMTDIDLYDANGNYFTSVEAQIATQYAYGNGTDTSCWAIKKTVSELLYELPISGYFSLNIEGISVLNDAVGGVKITVPKDYTHISPDFIKDKEIILDGKLAELYIRYRDTDKAGSNIERMERQRQYMPALLNQIKTFNDDFDELYDILYPKASSYLVTDLNTTQFEQLFEYEWNIDNVHLLEGESVLGEKHEEFHVNEENLQKKVIEMFYKLK